MLADSMGDALFSFHTYVIATVVTDPFVSFVCLFVCFRLFCFGLAKCMLFVTICTIELSENQVFITMQAHLPSLIARLMVFVWWCQFDGVLPPGEPYVHGFLPPSTSRSTHG